QQMAQPDGLIGDMEVIMYHLQAGTLAYAGFSVLPSFCAWSIHYCDDEQRRRYLDEYETRLRTLDQTEPLPFQKLSDFGPDWRLLPDAPAVDPGHRHVACGNHGAEQ